MLGKKQHKSTTRNTGCHHNDTPSSQSQLWQHNFGKDECVIDMMGHEIHYCQGTESGLLGVFEFKGACTKGDGSCDTFSKSMELKESGTGRQRSMLDPTGNGSPHRILGGP